jgi:hypothetical protein
MIALDGQPHCEFGAFAQFALYLDLAREKIDEGFDDV